MMPYQKGRILVTGGAGFIGSALIWELNRRGIDNILVADYLGRDEKWRNLTPLRFRDYLEADDLLKRLETAPFVFSDISGVFHLGACSSTTEINAAYLIRNNFEYTKTMAHFALAHDVRFVYASSAATYGALAGDISEDADLAVLRPLNMYGYSKQLFDLYAQRAGILPDITGLKYFNIYGPNENHKAEMRSVVNKAFHQIQETSRMSLFKSYRPEYGDGEQRRDFLYVKDAVNATLFLAENVGGGGIYNVGSGQANTWLSLAHALFSALGQAPAIDFVEMPSTLRPKYQYLTQAEIGKLRAAGFTQPFWPLADAVADYVKNYLVPDRHLGDEA